MLLQQRTAWQHPSVWTGACCLGVLRVCVGCTAMQALHLAPVPQCIWQGFVRVQIQVPAVLRQGE